MAWTIEYFEQEDTTQPAEIFEDMLKKANRDLRGKLEQVVARLQLRGYLLGGGYLEKCRDYQGLWEIRAIYSGTLAREFLGFDRERIVLLHGYTKRTGQPASKRDMEKAFIYWLEYMRTRRISPEKEKNNEQV